MIALKKLDDAIRDGDPIRAVLRNTGVNQDGKTNGIMVPKSDAQSMLIKRVYNLAGLNPQDTTVVEAHGTGTAVGDVAEMSALTNVFCGGTKYRVVHVGSLKPNIGHLESASGVAGIIKGVLMLEHDAIPATINIETLKPELALEQSGIHIPRKLMKWPEETLRRLSVNSFGYGGTNAHAILDRAPSPIGRAKSEETMIDGSTSIPQIIPLTAQSERSFRSLTNNLKRWISDNKNQRLEDLAQTLAGPRSKHVRRKAILASTLEELSTNLSSSEIQSIKVSPTSQIVFVFTGQGAQWHGMGRELLFLKSAFRLSIEVSDKILLQLGSSWSLLEELQHDTQMSQINEAHISQPATTALQIALVDLLVSVNVKPGIVLGHSSGEIAAAYAAGRLTHFNAMKVAYYRGQLKLETRGAMLAVAAGEEEVEPLLSCTKPDKAVIACANSQSSTTISGDAKAIDQLESMLRSRGIWNRRLKIDRAYHSHHMNAVADQYLQDLSGIDWANESLSVRLVSSVTGTPVDELGAEYWTDNLVSKVRFHSAFKRAITLCPTTDVSVIELGPHNALAGPIRQILSHDAMEKQVSLYSALVRNTSAIDSFTALIGKLFENGLPVDIPSVNRFLSPSVTPQVITSLPPYPWNHQTTYWHESQRSKNHRFRKFPQNDLLGLLIPDGSMDRPVWRNLLDLKTMPWLRDHVVDGQIIYPASAFVCMVSEAANQYAHIKHDLKDFGVVQLNKVEFLAPLVIPEAPQTVLIYLHLEPSVDANASDFAISTVVDQATSITHCRGKINLQSEQRQHQLFDGVTALPRYDNLQPVSEPYELMRSNGNTYGPQFALMEQLRMDSLAGFCNVRVSSVEEYRPASMSQGRALHPTTMDAMTHSSVSIFGQYHGGASIVVKSIDSITLHPGMVSMPGMALATQTSIKNTWKHGCRTDIRAYQNADSQDVRGSLILEQKGVVFQALSTNKSPLERRAMTYRPRWGPDVKFITAKQIISVSDSTQEDDLKQALKFEALNRASAVYIERCLKRLSNECVPPIEYHRWLLDWMRRFFRSESFSDSNAGTDPDQIIERASELGVEGEILSHIGNNLANILTAEMDPLSLITEKDLLWRLYADDASTRCYGHLIEYLKHLVFADPNMDVLEIGAGTGGATEPVLAALSDGSTSAFQSYVFSDISAAFFDRAKVRLQKWGKSISFEKLDIERDPSDQGFQGRKFDLVLASNVLHVSTSINGALSRIKSLLKPGGRLILIETVKNVPFYNTCLGVLPGWWAGAGDDRPDGPFLSVPQWDEAFARNGFGGVAISAKDFKNTAHRCALIISQPLEDVDVPSMHPTTVQIRCCPGIPHDLASHAMDALGDRPRFDLNHTSFFDAVDQDAEIILIDDSNSPVLTIQDDACFSQITSILSKAAKVFWISLPTVADERNQSYHSLIAGLARVARVENAGLRLVTLEVQDNLLNPTHAREQFRRIAELVDVVFAGRITEEDYVCKSGSIMITRLVPSRDASDKPGTSRQPPKSSVNEPDHKDGIEKEEDGKSQEDFASDEVEIQVHAWGVTHEADGTTANTPSHGKTRRPSEFSGIITKCGVQYQDIWTVGDRVCGLGSTGWTDQVRVNGDVIAKIPRGMSFVHAVAAPFSYTTAWYALVEVAALKEGHEVLVHGANTPLGQAVTAIAKWRGSRVTSTIEGDKSDGVSDAEISSDQSDSGFVGSTSSKAPGKSYDVVVNASDVQLPTEELTESVAELGTYIDLVYTQSSARTVPFIKEGTIYACPNVERLCQKDPIRYAKILKKVLSLIDTGELEKPLISLTSTNDLENITARISPPIPTIKERKIVVPIKAAKAETGSNSDSQLLQLASNETYIIAGGLGGLGYEIAKMLAHHGAGALLLLSRRVISPTEKASIIAEFADLGARIELLSCDIIDLPTLRDRLSQAMQTLPPVRGLVQCAMILRDRIISQMTLQDFTQGIAPKVTGTRNLLQALETQPLDFCLMLSSIIGSVAGTIAEGSYAAGNAFLSHLSQDRRTYGPRMITISPGAIEDVGILAQDSATKNILQRQGFPSVSSEHVLDLIRRGLYESLQGQDNMEIISGFDYESLKTADSPLLGKPMFSHLLRTKSDEWEAGKNSGSSQSKQTSLEEITSYEEAEQFILNSLKGKIASLVAMNEGIDLTKSLSELGADSLVVVELKNWINQTFQTSITTVLISDLASAQGLVQEIALQCPSIAKLKPAEEVPSPKEPALGKEQSELVDDQVSSESALLPRLPLPDLQSTLQYWLKAVSATLNESDYEEAQQMVKGFLAPESTAHVLQSRLQSLADDPTVDSWQERLYYANHHMKPRVPLVPHRCFYGVHREARHPHTQAERAAIIAVACSDFRTQAKMGSIKREVVNEQVLDNVQYQYLFNTSREPGIEEDVMAQYPDSEHIIVFRRGNAFKIPLTSDNLPRSLQSFRILFEQILAAEGLSDSPVGVLTNDSRTSWTRNRLLLRDVCAENKALLHDIESAAFIVNLDEASPATPSERGHLFMHADSNRWSDKPIQFTVTANGISAATGEHTMIDGYTMRRVNAHISAAIASYTPSNYPPPSPSALPPLSPFTFQTTPHLDHALPRVLETLHSTTALHTCTAFTTSTLSFPFLRAHKLSPRSALHVAIQLAYRLFHGTNPAAHEAVSLSHFLGGRVDINPILWPEVRAFCAAAALPDAHPASLYPSFVAAITAHASNLARCSRGQGSDRHLLCLEWAAESEEEKPAFFKGRIYRGSRPRMVMVDSLETGFEEVGSWPSSREGVWVHFEPGGEGVMFSMWGPRGEVQGLEESVRKGLEVVRRIVESGCEGGEEGDDL